MKNFLAVFTGSPEAMSKWHQLSDNERQAREKEGMQAWGAWMTKNASAIVDDGAPLGRTKRVTKDGTADIRNAMAAFVVVKAESHDAAAKLFLNHPHFTLFPGDGVEIMECLPMPSR